MRPRPLQKNVGNLSLWWLTVFALALMDGIMTLRERWINSQAEPGAREPGRADGGY
jgi:hypothetical protein